MSPRAISQSLLLLAGAGATCFAVGCAHHRGLANSPSTAHATPSIEASATTAEPALPRPYVIMTRLPETPKVAKHARQTLHVTKTAGHYYLADSAGDRYDVGRDSQGNLCPAYLVPGTGQSYPLYYDGARDNYYYVIDDSGKYYRCYKDDSKKRCYPDQNDYADYQPTASDRPVVYVNNTEYRECCSAAPLVDTAFIGFDLWSGRQGSGGSHGGPTPPPPAKNPGPVRPEKQLARWYPLGGMDGVPHEIGTVQHGPVERRDPPQVAGGRRMIGSSGPATIVDRGQGTWQSPAAVRNTPAAPANVPRPEIVSERPWTSPTTQHPSNSPTAVRPISQSRSSGWAGDRSAPPASALAGERQPVASAPIERQPVAAPVERHPIASSPVESRPAQPEGWSPARRPEPNRTVNTPAPVAPTDMSRGNQDNQPPARSWQPRSAPVDTPPQPVQAPAPQPVQAPAPQPVPVQQPVQVQQPEQAPQPAPVERPAPADRWRPTPSYQPASEPVAPSYQPPAPEPARQDPAPTPEPAAQPSPPAERSGWSRPSDNNISNSSDSSDDKKDKKNR